MNFIKGVLLATLLCQWSISAQARENRLDMEITTNDERNVFLWSEESKTYELSHTTVGKVTTAFKNVTGIFKGIEQEIPEETTSNVTTPLTAAENMRLRLLVDAPTGNLQLMATFSDGSLLNQTILSETVLTKGTYEDYLAGETIEFTLAPESKASFYKDIAQVIMDDVLLNPDGNSDLEGQMNLIKTFFDINIDAEVEDPIYKANLSELTVHIPFVRFLVQVRPKQ